jgi:hypothetical protein
MWIGGPREAGGFRDPMLGGGDDSLALAQNLHREFQKRTRDSISLKLDAKTHSTRLQSRREAPDELPDACQDGLLIARENPMVDAVELDELRLRDMAGKISAGADANSAVAAAVEQQGRS